MTEPAIEIHLKIGGQSYGPYDLQTVRDMQAAGQLKGDDPAWCEGLLDWTTLNGVLACVDPSNAPSPTEIPVSSKKDCPKCGAAMNPDDKSCYKCGYQPELQGKAGRHQRPLEPYQEEMQRKSILSRLGWALLIGGLLPVFVGNMADPTVVFPNFQMQGKPGWLAFLLLSPVIAGMGVVIVSSFIQASFRGVVALLMAGILIVPVAMAEAGGPFPEALGFMGDWTDSLSKGIPLAWLLMGFGWTALFGGARWRSFAPGSLTAYGLAAAGGVAVVLAWILPMLPEAQGGLLAMKVFKMYSAKSWLWLGIVLTLALLCHLVAVTFCVLSTRGKSTRSIVNMNCYAVFLLTGALIVPVLVAAGMQVYGAMQNGGQGIKLAVGLMGKLLLSAKAGLWLGGASVLIPMALADLCAGRVEQPKTGRRANDVGLPISEG